MIVGVPAEQFAQWWPMIMERFEDFADRSDGRVTVPGLVDEVMARRVQVYVWWTGEGVEMCAVTRLCQHPGGDAIHIEHCGGVGAEKWKAAFLEHVEDWAKAIGARRIIAHARPGWSKWMKTRNYREAHREMVMEVDHG